MKKISGWSIAGVFLLLVVVSVFLLARHSDFGFINSKASSAHLRYYGYYWADSNVYGHHLAESSNFTNLNFVDSVDGLKRCVSLQTQCMLQVRWEFWNGNKLVKNYKTNWNATKRNIQRALDASLTGLGAFYMIDEPDLSGISSTDLATVAKLIKTDFPNIPIVLVYSAGAITNTLQVPTNIDFVGFDHYGPMDQVTSILQTLKTRITPAQKVMLVAQSYPARGETDAQLADLNEQYYQLAEGDSRVIGILNFGMWVDGRANFTLLPQTVLKQKDISRRIFH